MSLIRFAVRFCAVQALTGRTLVGSSVYDSRNLPLADLISSEPAPFIVVCTDDDNAMDGRRELALVFETAVASAVGAQGETRRVAVPPTDEGLELTLDLLAHQIISILRQGGGIWGELFRDLICNMQDLRPQSQRGAGSRKGVRFAARQIILHLDTVDDPVHGAPIPAPLHAFAAALQAAPDTADIADLFSRLLTEATAPVDWRRAAASLGVNRRVIEGIGLAPVAPQTANPEDDTAAALERLIIAGLNGADVVIQQV